MRTAMTGPVLTMMLTAAMPAKGAPTLMACGDCQLMPARRSASAHKALAATPSPPFYDDLFRSGRSTVKGSTDHWASYAFASGNGGLSLETLRRIARSPDAAGRIGGPRDRLSVASGTLRYSTGIGPDDNVSFGLTAGMEKRRFAFDLARGHHVRSQSMGLVANWSHGMSWRLESGYRFDFGSRGASLFERGIELVEGAPRSQHGAWTALRYTIGKAESSTSLPDRNMVPGPLSATRSGRPKAPPAWPSACGHRPFA